MPNIEPPSKSKSQSEPLLTLRISKRAGWIALIAFAILGALIVAAIRSKGRPQPLANQPAVHEQKPAVLPQPTKVAANEETGSLHERSAGDGKIRTPKRPIDPSGLEGTKYDPVAKGGATIVEASQRHTYVIHEPLQDEQPILQPTVISMVEPTVAPTNEPEMLNGAGAVFPLPMYSKWFSEFHKLHPQIQFNYQAVGSGAGIHHVLAGTVDFGATDIPMSNEQLEQAMVKLLHIPTVLGAVVPIYNIPGVGGDKVKFTPEILAGIFLGKITTWNDATISKENPTVELPNLPITVVHRADGSGDTFMFTDYLSKVSPEWLNSVGKGTSVAWPVGLGGKGNEGVASNVKRIEGAIGYIDVLFAEQNHTLYGAVKNQAGEFVKAGFDNLTQAAASVREMPDDFRVSITDAPGNNAYPIASFTWLLVPQQSDNPGKRADLIAFLNWMLVDGQLMTRVLGYAPLPRNIAARAKQKIAHPR
jgi:phosphate transport system substrate-binding protein